MQTKSKRRERSARDRTKSSTKGTTQPTPFLRQLHNPINSISPTNPRNISTHYEEKIPRISIFRKSPINFYVIFSKKNFQTLSIGVVFGTNRISVCQPDYPLWCVYVWKVRDEIHKIQCGHDVISIFGISSRNWFFANPLRKSFLIFFTPHQRCCTHFASLLFYAPFCPFYLLGCYFTRWDSIRSPRNGI